MTKLPTSYTQKYKQEYRKKFLSEHPWHNSYANAQSRCKTHPSYVNRGIKFKMTYEDFKTLWFRDKAFLMTRPSIDRINGNGDYEISNCRYIELDENNRRGKTEGVSQYTLNGKFLRSFNTIREAAVFMGNINKVSCISRAAKRIDMRKTAFGYKWKLGKVGKLEEKNGR